MHFYKKAPRLTACFFKVNMSQQNRDVLTELIKPRNMFATRITQICETYQSHCQQKTFFSKYKVIVCGHIFIDMV